MKIKTSRSEVRRVLNRKRLSGLCALLFAVVMLVQFVFPKHGAAAIALRSVSTAGSAGTVSSLSVTPPAGATTGDLLIITSSVTYDTTCTATLSNGATVTVHASAGTPTLSNGDIANSITTYSNAGSTLQFSAWYVFLTSPPGASITISYTCTPKASIGVLSYTGVDTTNPIDAFAKQEAAATSTITAPSVITTVANDRIVALFDTRTGTTISSPTNGTTLEYSVASTGQGATSRETQAAADTTQTVAGPTGTFSATAAASGDTIGATIALTPAGAAPPNSSPAAPALSTPSSGQTGVAVQPVFQLKTTDPDSDYLRYEIDLYQSDCTTLIGKFSENTSQTGWSGQNAQAATAYNSGSTATYTYQGTLAGNTTYCWKGAAVDPGGTNTFGSFSAAQLFTTGTATPSAAVILGGGTTVTGGVHYGN